MGCWQLSSLSGKAVRSNGSATAEHLRCGQCLAPASAIRKKKQTVRDERGGSQMSAPSRCTRCGIGLCPSPIATLSRALPDRIA